MEESSLAKITAKIIEDAQAAAEETLRMAREEADRIVADAASFAEDQYVKAMASAEKNAKGLLARADSSFDMERKRLLLSEKQVLLSECYGLLASRLQSLNQEELLTLLAGYVLRNTEEGSDCFELILRPEDCRGYLGTQLTELCRQHGRTGRITLVPDSSGIQGGVILRTGKVIKNFSFEAILRMLREQTEGEMVDLLFSAG